MIDIEKISENFNLEKKEAAVYLATLELGKSKASAIANKASLNRITTYEILKRLRQRGIANSYTYTNITYFQVISPQRLLEKLKRQVDLGQELLPELSELQNKKKKGPKFEYFEGTEGVKVIYDDTLNCKEKIIYNIAHPDNLLNFIGNDYFTMYVKKRVRKKIGVKVLIPKSEINLKLKKEVKTALRDVKFFDNEKFPIPNEIMIYDNKVVLLSFSNKIGIVIEDPEISQTMKSIWMLLDAKLLSAQSK